MSYKNNSNSIDMRLSTAKFWRIWMLEDGYLYDWLTAVIIVIINYTVPLLAVKPVERYYMPSDPTLSYPDASGTISGTVLYILAFLFPGVVMVCSAFWSGSFHDGHHGLLTLLESFALTSGWKRWMNLVGVYRPRWLAVLASGDKGEVQDARQSYPSGHSAYMFCGCVVLTLYLLGKLKVLAQPGKGQFLLAGICLVPVMLATFVAVTRIYDYEHAPADVNAGCFIGLASAVLAYFLNYHSVLDQHCAQPKTRKWTTKGLSAVRASEGHDALEQHEETTQVFRGQDPK